MNVQSLLKHLSALLLRRPETKEQMLLLLRGSFEKRLMDADAFSIIEGALASSETRVTDVLVPRAQMDVIDLHEPIAEILPFVIQAAHSRFPVVDGDRDNIQGILLAKDLLRLQTEPEFILRDWLRPAVFVPESKRLNVLLREFRASRNHMAIVVDEYGGVAGLITIEDVLEQIVGDIEDEYDFDEAHDNILQDAAGLYRVKARTEIDDFNAAFGTNFPSEEFDTIGGLILRHLGRVPKRNEIVEIEGLRFNVLRADSRRLYTLVVDAMKNKPLANQ
ncbi:MAG: CBS domain-containing protein [Betaproteobacteria bacterium]|nr:CBS domain-containing protein [Betaproteobacteria bacterium]